MTSVSAIVRTSRCGKTTFTPAILRELISPDNRPVGRDRGRLQKSRPANALLAVPGRDDVRLDGVFRRIRGVARDDASFVERTVALVGAAAGLAAVAAASEDDRALLLHRAPPSR